MASMTAYQARSVAVPYGNCTEPTNIKAGGKSYRPRFQCADCGIYRPDSSCLPAIEEHFHHPRGTEHETAHTLGAAALVTRNLPDKIDACTEAAEKVHKQLPGASRADQLHSGRQGSGPIELARLRPKRPRAHRSRPYPAGPHPSPRQRTPIGRRCHEYGHQLGDSSYRQPDRLRATDLTDRIGELTAQNQELCSRITQLKYENQ
jgi:hypothetical protein